ncbi:MAG: hypothetical protein HY247_04315 [archaeon]|nr:MAG: hypothetical protein HY247_04315 [archaeon]
MRKLPPSEQEMRLIEMLVSEAGLTPEEGTLYLRLLQEGSARPGSHPGLAALQRRGMAILSGDDTRIIPVHPRLGIANYYRTWREKTVREINERRIRTDKLILELIPVYEATIEKRMSKEAGR